MAPSQRNPRHFLPQRRLEKPSAQASSAVQRVRRDGEREASRVVGWARQALLLSLTVHGAGPGNRAHEGAVLGWGPHFGQNLVRRP